MHVPCAADEPVAPAVAVLGALAAAGELVVCAGAGLSKADPTSLPLGWELAEIVSAALRSHLGHEALAGVDSQELLSVADAVEAMAGGEALLQARLVDAAPYLVAEPNYGHAVLALLLLDGALEVVLTNYDNCIERGGGPFGRLEAVVSEADRAQVRGPAVLKVHGCATRAGTLLASTRQLAEPPTWVFHYVGERLGSASVVFIGLGDVAAYVRIRIQQLLDAVGDAARVWVAATSLSDVWKELVPDIGQRFIEMSADKCLDELSRDSVRIAFERVRNDAARHRGAGTYAALGIDPTEGADALVTAVMGRHAVAIVAWLRSAAHRWPAGETVVQSTAVREALVALALVGSKKQLAFDGRRLTVADERVELLLVRSIVASAVAEAAHRRVSRWRAAGDVRVDETVTVVCHGHQGPLPQQVPVSVIPGETSDDIIDGPNVPLLSLVSVHRLLDGELPAEWAA